MALPAVPTRRPWKRLASRDPATNLAILNYLTREFRAAARLGLLRGDVRVYSSGAGFLFNDAAVEQFVFLRGNLVAGMERIDAPDAAALAGYTLVLGAGDALGRGA